MSEIHHYLLPLTIAIGIIAHVWLMCQIRKAILGKQEENVEESDQSFIRRMSMKERNVELPQTTGEKAKQHGS